MRKMFTDHKYQNRTSAVLKGLLVKHLTLLQTTIQTFPPDLLINRPQSIYWALRRCRARDLFLRPTCWMFIVSVLQLHCWSSALLPWGGRFSGGKNTIYNRDIYSNSCCKEGEGNSGSGKIILQHEKLQFERNLCLMVLNWKFLGISSVIVLRLVSFYPIKAAKLTVICSAVSSIQPNLTQAWHKHISLQTNHHHFIAFLLDLKMPFVVGQSSFSSGVALEVYSS